MPRQRRLNVPGVLHHVIVRGINRQNIFLDDNDRQSFLDGLEAGLERTQCRCYAWVLMPNHVHLLLRSGAAPLSDLMRRFLTGYAVRFNHRHRRSGYLFQNRFKSILCQEETYFLELVRYIHLNPVRAKMVGTMEELDRFPWSGHGVLVGKGNALWQDKSGVLQRFGKWESKAVSGYRQFLRDGWMMGRRTDLTGGGLRRSSGGWEALKQMSRNKAYQRGDERILGDGDFVTEVLKESEDILAERERLARDGWTWERLVEKVCQLEKLSTMDLVRKGRNNAISRAKEILVSVGVKKMGMTQKEIAMKLGVSQAALSQIYRVAPTGMEDKLLS